MMLKAMVDRVYSDSRVEYSCVRKSFLENKKNHKELRGREEFVRVSWDVALWIWRLKSLKKSLKKTSITLVMVAGGMRVACIVVII
ncbi:hypothetical protein HpEKA17_11990 [Helicobacter pylori]